MSMMKIALPPGFKIRICLEEGRDLGLQLKAFFWIKHFIFTVLVSVWWWSEGTICGWSCFGDHIHHTTKFHGKVFLTYTYPYPYMCQCIYPCIVQYPFHAETTASHLIDAILPCSDRPSTWWKPKRYWDCAWWWLLLSCSYSFNLHSILYCTLQYKPYEVHGMAVNIFRLSL